LSSTAATPIGTAGRSSTRNYWLLVAALALVAALGYGAAHEMDARGHAITGMDNHVVWGLPHVFAIFLIVAASGVLNVASVGSVFGVAAYKARARLSALLALALLAGGLAVLVLDLGRPERIVVAATHFNFKSIFAWNVLLYSGLAALVAVYLWALFERRYEGFTKPVGVAVLVWRFVLTSGTGSIFGLLVAREAYQSALLAPLFIVLSLGWGLAVFLLAQGALFAARGAELPEEIEWRLRRLLAIFIAAALYLVAVVHVTNAYYARASGLTAFLLRDGGEFPLLFWTGYVLLGSVVPFVLLLWRAARGSSGLLVAAVLVVLGAFGFLYAFIIGGQAWPMEIFPGYEAASAFNDGQTASYAPSLHETLLGFGGVALAALVAVTGVRVLDFMPHDDEAGARG
jgi:molybdopterin-containing oxidoreductase family membrane subunit